LAPIVRRISVPMAVILSCSLGHPVHPLRRCRHVHPPPCQSYLTPTQKPSTGFYPGLYEYDANPTCGSSSRRRQAGNHTIRHPFRHPIHPGEPAGTSLTAYVECLPIVVAPVGAGTPCRLKYSGTASAVPSPSHVRIGLPCFRRRRRGPTRILWSAPCLLRHDLGRMWGQSPQGADPRSFRA
jgi:hypothetical protein